MKTLRKGSRTYAWMLLGLTDDLAEHGGDGGLGSGSKEKQHRKARDRRDSAQMERTSKVIQDLLPEGPLAQRAACGRSARVRLSLTVPALSSACLVCSNLARPITFHSKSKTLIPVKYIVPKGNFLRRKLEHLY